MKTLLMSLVVMVAVTPAFAQQAAPALNPSSSSLCYCAFLSPDSDGTVMWQLSAIRGTTVFADGYAANGEGDAANQCAAVLRSLVRARVCNPNSPTETAAQ